MKTLEKSSQYQIQDSWLLVQNSLFLGCNCFPGKLSEISKIYTGKFFHPEIPLDLQWNSMHRELPWLSGQHWGGELMLCASFPSLFWHPFLPHLRGDSARKHTGESEGVNCFMENAFRDWPYGRSPRSQIFKPYLNPPPDLILFFQGSPKTPKRISHRERCRQAGGLRAGEEVNPGNSISCSVGEKAGELRGLFFP